MFAWFVLPDSVTIIDGITLWADPFFQSFVQFIWIPIAVTVAIGAFWFIINIFSWGIHKLLDTYNYWAHGYVEDTKTGKREYF